VHKQVRCVEVLGEGFDVAVDGHRQFLCGVEVDVVHFFDADFQGFCQAEAGIDQNFLFAFDMVIEAGRFHVHRAGDVAHGGIEIPFFAHQSQSGSHDLLSACHFNRLTKLTNTR